jgi:AcrR family transcriptional regulator
MPRPTDPNRRQNLLARAWPLIRQRSPELPSMKELADALGVKRPTLYFYFPDTTSILEAVAADTLKRHQQFLVQHLAGRHHPVDFVYTWAVTSHRFFASSADDLAAFATLQAAMRPGAEGAAGRLAALFDTHTRPVNDLVAKTLRDGMARGFVAPCEPEAVVQLVATIVEGAIVARGSQGRDGQATLDQMWKSILAPLRLPPLEARANRPATSPPTVEAARPQVGPDPSN